VERTRDGGDTEGRGGTRGRLPLGGVAHLHLRRLGFGEDPRQGGKGGRTGLQPERAGLVADNGAHEADRADLNNFHNPLFLEVFDLFTRGLQERGLRPLLVNLSR
jgi:hypothetical protein